ncbi:MAG: hypothetical protein K6U87_14415 [Firmicutes bacterium]|nr:hypothetical protein [Bacillota bacterium]
MRYDALAGRWAVAFAAMVVGLVVLHLLPLGFLGVVLGWAWVWLVAFRHVLAAPAGGVGWLRGAGLGAAGNFAANLAVFLILGAIAAANPGLGLAHPATGLALGLAGLSEAAGLVTAPILGFALGAIGGAAADGRKAHRQLLEAVGRRPADDGGDG